MIVKMSKYAFLVYHKEYEQFLLKLRELGVVHVKGNDSILDNVEAQELLQQRKRIDTTLKQLKVINSTSPDVVLPADNNIPKEEGAKLLDFIEELQTTQSSLRNEIDSIDKDISYLDSIWGDFSYELLLRLNDAGYSTPFFSCPVSEYLILIRTVQSLNYFIAIAPKGQTIDIPAERVKLPAKDFKALTNERGLVAEKLEGTQNKLKTLAIEQYNSLIGVDKQLQDEFNLSRVVEQTTTELDDKLMLLEGWVPTEKGSDLEQGLDQGGYFFRKLEIGEHDQIPIKLKNNSFTKLYEPICRMFSLPNYHEFDPTPFFAPFFMLFFGMCFADGGYGLLMLIACTVLKGKVNPDYKPYLTMFQYLGTAAFIVGCLSGSFFGVELVKLSAFASVKDYFLTSDNLMTISLVLGIIHILFGKSVAALKKISQKGIKYGIASFAWVFVITSGILAFGLPVLDIKISELTTNILLSIAGLSLIPALLYNSPGKNIFLNLGSGIWNMYNIASGMLGDTLSYIRLFAIGLTGAILGSVFNSLAMTMTYGMSIIPKVIFMTIILLFGHTLNFGLCTISSLIHPLRLVFVEYYKNAEFEGGGKEYEPFKKA